MHIGCYKIAFLCLIIFTIRKMLKLYWPFQHLILSPCEVNNKGENCRLQMSIWWMVCFWLLWQWAKVNLISQINFLRDIHHTMLALNGTLGITWRVTSQYFRKPSRTDHILFMISFDLRGKLCWNFIFLDTNPLGLCVNTF